MLALFEVLSLEGWLEIRDIIMDRMGPVSTQSLQIILEQRSRILATRDLRTHLCVHRYTHRFDSVRRCRHCQLLGE